jgi:hypothetical protein
MNHRKAYLTALIAAMLLSLTACQRKNLERRIFNDLETRCNLTSNCTLQLTKYTDFSWDRMYVFEGANFSKADIEKAIGTSYPDSPDLQKVWVFMNHGALVYHQSSPRSVEQPLPKSIQFADAYDPKANGYASYSAETTFKARTETTKDGSHYYVFKPVKLNR